MGGRPHEVVPVRETKMGVPGTKSDSHRHFRRSSLGRRPSLFLLVLTLGVAWYKYQAHSRKRQSYVVQFFVHYSFCFICMRRLLAVLTTILINYLYKS